MGLEFGKTKLNTSDRIDFFKNLGGWLNAGAGRTSVGEAVANTTDAFSHEEYATLRPRMEAIKHEVKSGQITLYEALHAANLGFVNQELAIIEAAEKTNQLRHAVPALVAAMDMQNRANKQLISSLLGPVLIGVALIVMSLGVLLFMLPLVIEPVIQRNEKAVDKFPIILQYYWGVSVWLRANPYILPTLAGSMLGLFLARKTPLLNAHYQKLLLSWKVSRKIILGYNAVIAVYYMPALLRSGMPAYQVLYNMAKCIKNTIISNEFRLAAIEHEAGARLSQSVINLPFRASFVNAITAGEATGHIADRLQELQEPYTIEMNKNISSIVATLKFIVMGALLPFFIVSAYTALVGPIFALMEY